MAIDIIVVPVPGQAVSASEVAVAVVTSPSPTVYIEAAQRGPTGPTGAPGATGPQGTPGVNGEAASFSYNQNTPSMQWTVVHNLNKKPSITIVDSAGSEWLPDAYYLDSNTVILSFSAAFSGIAYLI